MFYDVQKIVLNANKFDSFNPMQIECTKKGFENSMIVFAPTASGKTIIAELYSLYNVLNKRKKVIYTCPLKALASEHYKDFKKKYSTFVSPTNSTEKIRFALSTGDLDSNSSYLNNFDVIMTTYEKLASLLRHKAEWLNSVECIIIDELHEIDSNRGVVLEIALTQLRTQNPKLKVLGLSATIPNAKSLANWLNADIIESSYRPTKLREGVGFEGVIEYNNNSTEKNDLENLIETSLVKEKQILVFLNSRKRAESFSTKVSTKTKKFVEPKKEELEKLSQKILAQLENPTPQCHSLSNCVKNGSAFHHAGLINEQRELVEEGFRKGLIKTLCSTTTLSAGVNTPADLVIMPSLYRFEDYGMNLISVREYKQCAGRSGRPKFSSEGKSVVFANSIGQKKEYLEKFVNGEVEQVYSKLGVIPILRTHILALIASGYIWDLDSTKNFFSKTLYAFQYQEMGELVNNLIKIIDELEGFGFVKKGGEKFFATKLGERVSQLFLDPVSAFELISALKEKKTFTPFSYLYTWVSCSEFYPLLYPPKQLIPLMREEISNKLDEIPFSEEKVFFDSDSNEKIFSAIILSEWIREKREDDLFSEYSLTPGTLLSKNKIIEWLAYSTIELSKILGQEKHINSTKKLALRVKYGVKEELLSLVELKGVGRVRARKLFNSRIKSINDVRNNFERVELLLGKKVATGIKKQLKISD